MYTYYVAMGASTLASYEIVNIFECYLATTLDYYTDNVITARLWHVLTLYDC